MSEIGKSLGLLDNFLHECINSLSVMELDEFSIAATRIMKNSRARVKKRRSELRETHEPSPIQEEQKK